MSQDTINIKGTRHGLVIILDSNCAFEVLKKDLSFKLEAAKGFFKGAKFSLRQENMATLPAEQQIELENICKQFGLVPNIEEPAAAPTINQPGTSVPTPLVTTIQTKKATPAVPTTASYKSKPGEDAVLVRRSLRSGQRITAKGHVVVMGDVNYGAEIVASGSIFVIGHCRGIIHAGSEGNQRARIVAWKLEPTVISIAGRRHAASIMDKQTNGCQVVELKGKDFVFTPYTKTIQ